MNDSRVLGERVSWCPLLMMEKYLHYHPTNFIRGPQPQYHAGILCLTHNDKFSMLLPTKREFYHLFIFSSFLDRRKHIDPFLLIE